MQRVVFRSTIAIAVTLLTLCSASAVRANDWDQLTYFTFSGPVEIPGVTLPAGTYMFKLADTMSDRQITQVFSEDGAKLYATFFTLPTERLASPAEPLVTFEETRAGSPEAIKQWFYPGDRIGHEFVYPREQARAIAAAHQPVLGTISRLQLEK
jgi:hypothetical protein